MGAIQNQINQALGQASIAAGVGKHAIAEAKQAKIAEAKNQAEIAATQEQLNAAKLAYKNDTIEATMAIKAHEGDAGRTVNDFDPVIGGKKLSEYVKKDDKGKMVLDNEALSKVFSGLSEKEVEDLANEVDKFRSGTLTKNTNERLTAASNLPEEGRHTVKRAKTIPGQRVWRQSINVKTGKVEDLYRDIPAKHVPGKYISNKEYKNQQLEKAYIAERELNDRIAASRELKFDIKAATEKISRLQQGGKK